MEQQTEQKQPKKDTARRSWFCVLNNPEKHFPELQGKTPEEICKFLSGLWCTSESRSGGWAYCVSAEGLHHVHCVLECCSVIRLSAVKKIYPAIHAEPTQGNKSQVIGYIEKREEYEKGEKVLYVHYVGEIQGRQGKRTDLEKVAELVADGMTPMEILKSNVNFYRLESYITKMYYQKRLEETPFHREVVVYWHFGETGTGKSYTATAYMEKYGRERVAFINASSGGRFPFDSYQAQEILFIDELRESGTDNAFNFETMLSVLDGYTVELRARFQNRLMLWNEVHITTPFTPLELYDYYMKQKVNKIDQLLRRIRYYVYHYKDNTTGEYMVYQYDNANTSRHIARDFLLDQSLRFAVPFGVWLQKNGVGVTAITPTPTNTNTNNSSEISISQNAENVNSLEAEIDYTKMTSEEYARVTGESDLGGLEDFIEIIGIDD